ncbi:hypothetical protein FACS1894187_13460 [Synergistales bacterium]|nr:hypothetical protein FACS1894187_13460 [Synergistales bacterium]
MPVFEMVKYGRLAYPKDMALNIEEIACNFDKSALTANINYSISWGAIPRSSAAG